MSQRQVRAFTGDACEGKADDLRLHLVEAGGFGIDASQFSSVEFCYPGIELRVGENAFVVARVDEDCLLCSRLAGRPAGGARILVSLFENSGVCSLASLRERAGVRGTLMQRRTHSLKTKLLIKLVELGNIRCLMHDRVEFK